MDRPGEDWLTLVKQQGNLIQELKKKIEFLEDRVNRLTISKASNGKYPYYDFILSYAITPETQTQIHRLFAALSEKLSGRPIPPGLKDAVRYPTEFLYNAEPLRFKDVLLSLSNIWPVADEATALLLIKSMKAQEIHEALCDYLLGLPETAAL